jgi:hypothetical protein
MGEGRDYCKAPCEVWDPYLKKCVKTYDPATHGCCKKADGTYDVVPNPENEDPCKSKEMTDFCAAYSGNYGRTLCYNGEKVPCTCEGTISGWNKAVIDCLKAHEEGHKNAPEWDCPNCKTKPANPTDPKKANEKHCELYREMDACLKKIPGGTPGKDALQQESDKFQSWWCQ